MSKNKVKFVNKKTNTNHLPTIFLSNISEDVWPFINSLTIKEKQAEITENAFLAAHDLFAFTKHDSIRIIIPQALDPQFWQYYQEKFSHQDFQYLFPEKHHGQLSLDVLADSKLLKKLLSWIGPRKELLLLSYSATSQFFQLKNYFEKKGIKVLTPESPQLVDLWTVNFFGSKTGIRQLISALPKKRFAKPQEKFALM